MDTSPQIPPEDHTISSNSQANEDPTQLIWFIIFVWFMIYRFRGRTRNPDMQLVAILLYLMIIVANPRNFRQLRPRFINLLECVISTMISLLILDFEDMNRSIQQ
ncbi:unnamed protein product [Caenorhabditis angaria]|uniref:Transmembrane protein n=1 Tax=Caenorhabditis angaria TaxID=860376 RepID=A0A9P1N1N8_9PELO|nr:unnamed protein product [Caenorhabditis angaria]